ncbi:c-type cytochrome biogenesis protein CcsB [Exiguobacterium aurantiacum]|jgi:cytochrome c-type biogenesis protein CcsB|uniref:c-type cytochrome biogenesis protein CcsB n=1 Tax=Exiguobacterium aurantiacum TaxID=33987 RepID=UPI00384DC696
MEWIQWSSRLLFIAFILYAVATVLFTIAVSGMRKDRNVNRIAYGKYAFMLAVIGFIAQMGYFILRWVGVGYAPVSNLYEYTTFFGMMMVLGFLVVYGIYKNDVLGLFAMPVALLVIAFASMFSSEVAPLIPALNSVWLKIHVTTAALGQGILAISFASGLIFLLNETSMREQSKSRTWLEVTMFVLMCTLGFILVSMLFKAIGAGGVVEFTNDRGTQESYEYFMPMLFVPEGAQLVSGASGLSLELPTFINTLKLNTLIWSVIAGAVIYVLLRFVILRKRVAEALQPLAKKVDLDLADEISYRSIAIGLPVFILGGLIFAMIWAQIAWNRFWGWDPKEVWALITMLIYIYYLHMRIQRGWTGTKAAWLCVGGFAVIMFNLVFVNLVIAGLHSYA